MPLKTFELRNMLRQEEDPMDAVLKINSGAGGTESQDWASMLMRMYTRWAESHGYKCTVSNYQDGDEVGIKTVTMQIEGEFAYGYLKSENGVHRLVCRLPQCAGQAHDFVCIGVRDAFGGRFHRSDVDPSCVHGTCSGSGGAGGQNASTRWRPACACATNIKTLIRARKKKSSSKTRKAASSWRTARMPCAFLKSQLYDRALQKRKAKQAEIEAGKKKIEWGSQIRSYVFDDRRVKDHRTNYQTSDVNGVMDGNWMASSSPI